MINRLKTRFIILAMVSLSILLAAIVTGMNIISYRKVVSDADARLEVIEENSEWFLYRSKNSSGNENIPQLPDGADEPSAASGPADTGPDEFFGHRGKGGPSMSRDEAEETRFFFVTLDVNGNVEETNIDRIAAVDTSEAAEYAERALSSGNNRGFVDDYRYSVNNDGDSTRIMFLDCGRVLGSFRNFLRASIIMSLTGLMAVFIVICYFAGRIVRPVAESYEKQKRFITDAGHEIKTPLAIIKANLDLMDMQMDSVEALQGRSAETDELRDGLGEIGGQVDRLTGLTNDLVYLSRMEEAEHTLVMTEVPLSDIVSESISAFEPLAREQGRTIKSDVAPGITVKGSTKELEKLMSIILENAVKYSASADGSEEPPQIDAALRKEGRSAVIEVRNLTGSEQTNETLSHVFERFYRTDSSRNSQTGGHGIGLSMASAIVNLHGGKISARTSNGHDFIVTATLPAV